MNGAECGPGKLVVVKVGGNMWKSISNIAGCVGKSTIHRQAMLYAKVSNPKDNMNVVVGEIVVFVDW